MRLQALIIHSFIAIKLWRQGGLEPAVPADRAGMVYAITPRVLFDRTATFTNLWDPSALNRLSG